MTPKDALIRGGHKYPEKILADLEAGKCIVYTEEEIESLKDIWYEQGYQNGYQNGLFEGGIDI